MHQEKPRVETWNGGGGARETLKTFWIKQLQTYHMRSWVEMSRRQAVVYLLTCRHIGESRASAASAARFAGYPKYTTDIIIIIIIIIVIVIVIIKTDVDEQTSRARPTVQCL